MSTHHVANDEAMARRIRLAIPMLVHGATEVRARSMAATES